MVVCRLWLAYVCTPPVSGLCRRQGNVRERERERERQRFAARATSACSRGRHLLHGHGQSSSHRRQTQGGCARQRRRRNSPERARAAASELSADDPMVIPVPEDNWTPLQSAVEPMWVTAVAGQQRQQQQPQQQQSSSSGSRRCSLSGTSWATARPTPCCGRGLLLRSGWWGLQTRDNGFVIGARAATGVPTNSFVMQTNIGELHELEAALVDDEERWQPLLRRAAAGSGAARLWRGGSHWRGVACGHARQVPRGLHLCRPCTIAATRLPRHNAAKGKRLERFEAQVRSDGSRRHGAEKKARAYIHIIGQPQAAIYTCIHTYISYASHRRPHINSII